MFARTVALLCAAAVVRGRATINDQKVVDAINAKSPLWKAGRILVHWEMILLTFFGRNATKNIALTRARYCHHRV